MIQISRKPLFLSLIALGLSGTGLWIRQRSFETSQSYVLPNAKQAVHPNGLTLLIPQDYIAKKQRFGFTMQPENSKLYRHSTSIEVIIVNDNNYPKLELPSTTKFAGRTIQYTEEVNEDQGASGAPNYSISAYETTQKGIIKYQQSIQSENGKPDLSLLWPIIANTKLR